MARALWLADTFREAGLRVVETSGWKQRGSNSFNPKWVMEHHTASNRNGGNAPALNTVIHGRSDLPGPLANWLTARDGTIFVIASGRANHAGTGSYPDGTSGNSLSLGDEAENDGVGEPWPRVQKDAIERAGAAALRKINQGADHCIGHREYTRRKIDPTYNMADHRIAVAQWLGGLPPSKENDGMYLLIRNPDTGEICTFNGGPKVPIPNEDALNRHRFILAAFGFDNRVLDQDPGFYNTIPYASTAENDLKLAKWTSDTTTSKVLGGIPPASGGGTVDVVAIAKATAAEHGRRLSNG